MVDVVAVGPDIGDQLAVIRDDVAMDLLGPSDDVAVGTAVLLDVACHGKLLSFGLLDMPTVRSGGPAAGSGLIRRRVSPGLQCGEASESRGHRRITPWGPKGLEPDACPSRVRRHRRDQSMRKEVPLALPPCPKEPAPCRRSQRPMPPSSPDLRRRDDQPGRPGFVDICARPRSQEPVTGRDLRPTTWSPDGGSLEIVIAGPP